MTDMTAYYQISTLIDRPVADVFDFHARKHVQNHNRWDPDIVLWLDKDLPLEVGSIIHRHNTRSGVLVEGTMQVVKFEPDHMVEMLVHDGPAEMVGRSVYEAVNDHQTIITIMLEIPGMDDTADKTFLNSRLERTARNIKKLVESEYPEK